MILFNYKWQSHLVAGSPLISHLVLFQQYHASIRIPSHPPPPTPPPWHLGIIISWQGYLLVFHQFAMSICWYLVNFLSNLSSSKGFEMWTFQNERLVNSPLSHMLLKEPILRQIHGSSGLDQSQLGLFQALSQWRQAKERASIKQQSLLSGKWLLCLSPAVIFQHLIFTHFH